MLEKVDICQQVTIMSSKVKVFQQFRNCNLVTNDRCNVVKLRRHSLAALELLYKCLFACLAACYSALFQQQLVRMWVFNSIQLGFSLLAVGQMTAGISEAAYAFFLHCSDKISPYLPAQVGVNIQSRQPTDANVLNHTATTLYTL